MSLYVDVDYSSTNYTTDDIYIDWGSKTIFVPVNFLTLVQTNPTTIYNMDLNTFRLKLKDLEDSIDGMPFLDTHKHNTTVVVGGVELARVIEIINDYTVTFEDGKYAVNLFGANSNVGDVINVNQVSIRSANSAGLINYSSDLTATNIADAVWNKPVIENTVSGSFGEYIQKKLLTVAKFLGLK